MKIRKLKNEARFWDLIEYAGVDLDALESVIKRGPTRALLSPEGMKLKNWARTARVVGPAEASVLYHD